MKDLPTITEMRTQVAHHKKMIELLELAIRATQRSENLERDARKPIYIATGNARRLAEKSKSAAGAATWLLRNYYRRATA